MKAAGAHWDCCHVSNFYGWEHERIIIATDGSNLMEMITRAKTMLCILLVDDGYHYSDIKGYFQQAAEEGLVEIVKLNDDEGNEELDEVKEVNKGDGCLPGCCTS